MTSIKVAKVLYLKRSENSRVRNIISMINIRITCLHFLKQLFKACFGRENRNFWKVFFVKCFYRLLFLLLRRSAADIAKQPYNGILTTYSNI